MSALPLPDLAQCADEPIRSPGAVQPHGRMAVLAADDGRLLAYSGNWASEQEAREAMDQLVADERAYNAAVERFTAVKDAVDSLRGTAVVVNTLVWDTGFPQDGLSAMSRLLEKRFLPRPPRSALLADREPQVPIWVQAASTAVGQVWAGPYRDSDSNSVLEFAAPEAPLPKERWTRELNFLSFEPNSGKATSLSLATSERWKDRQTGEVREETEWHRGELKNDFLADLAARLRKGMTVCVSGPPRNPEKAGSGNDQFSTEIVVSGYNGALYSLTSAS